MEWLLKKCEKLTERYLEDEKFIISFVTMPFWKRLFFGKRIILNHLSYILNKYISGEVPDDKETKSDR